MYGNSLYFVFFLVTVLSLRCNSRKDLGEVKVESHASSETQPNLAALLLDTTHLQPGSQPHQCVGGNTVHLASVSACTSPGPPHDLLEREGTGNPPLTRTTLGQLCAAAWVSPFAAGCDTAWNRTKICSDTASTVMQCLRPLHHSGGL